jgi:uncharacterized protein (TIGR02453 family)
LRPELREREPALGDFRGFGRQALPFFKALRFHQSKEWFEENRALYESDVLGPFTALLDDLAIEFGKRKIPLKANGRKSIFRIHRDVRFSKDKSPYKCHAGAVMTRSGAKGEQGLLYVHIDPEGCFVAAGFHMLDGPQLAAMREAIRRKPAQFEKTVKALEKAKLAFTTSEGFQMTRLPRGYEEFKDSPLAGALRLKSFIVEESVKDGHIGSPKLVGLAADFAERSMPLLQYGWEVFG